MTTPTGIEGELIKEIFKIYNIPTDEEMEDLSKRVREFVKKIKSKYKLA